MYLELALVVTSTYYSINAVNAKPETNAIRYRGIRVQS